MKSFVFILILMFSTPLWSQQPVDKDLSGQNQNAIPEVIDSLYREDQFYIGLSFNLITNEPVQFSQNGFSGGLHLGFIRDMPINERRNVAIAVGLGLSTNTYNSNLFIGERENEQSVFRIIDNIQNNSNANRFNTNLIELPIQLRWRTSTPTTFNFWRIYSGVKLGYVFYYRSTFKDENITVRQTNIPELNKLRYNATLSIGNGSFNAFVNYSLNTLFNKDAVTVSGEQLGLQPIKFGVEFYFL